MRTKKRRMDLGGLRSVNFFRCPQTDVKAHGEIQFVDQQSASLHGKRIMYLTTDHSGLNKFHGFEDENFLLVQPEIQRIVQMSSQRVKERYRDIISLLCNRLRSSNFSLTSHKRISRSPKSPFMYRSVFRAFL